MAKGLEKIKVAKLKYLITVAHSVAKRRQIEACIYDCCIIERTDIDCGSHYLEVTRTINS